MSVSTIHTRPAGGEATDFRVSRAPEDTEPWTEDAAHYPGGATPAVLFPQTELDVANIVRQGKSVLVVGSQSSLTGGATPRGEQVVSTARMKEFTVVSSDRVRVGPGLVLAEMCADLAARGCWYPPVPTYDGATVGGTVATNAAGASTFKHGSTRDWVEALTVVLADGEVLEVARGQVVASAEGCFTIVSSQGRVTTVRVPNYTMPDVAKRSAGYHAQPSLDLVDLFIGSEGTLGIVVSVELRVASPPPAVFAGFVPVADDSAAIALVGQLRDAARATWARGDHARGDDVDIAAVEYIDRRCIELLRADGADRRLGFPLPESAGAAVIFQAELDPSYDRARAYDDLAAIEDDSVRTPLLSVCRILASHGAFESCTPVLPGEGDRLQALFGLREAVPEAVNRRIGERSRTIDPSITKSSGDVIVPFERFADSLTRYREILGSRGLDHAIWGHISDGNVHPNVLPTGPEDMTQAREAQLEIGAAAIALGGCPLSEHGVGRNPVKQALLAELYGEDGIEQMRAVKRALDPAGLLAPGVVFSVDRAGRDVPGRSGGTVS